MRAEFVREICCPARECLSGELRLEVGASQVLNYRNGPVEEVREGAVTCGACGRAYPIEGYVLSFEQLFPEALREEARFWGKWYGFMWSQGHLGFFDLRAPMAPQIAQGVEALDPSTLERKDLGGSHSILADHPLIKDAEAVLDIGCGTGWSSLFLARRGHRVVGFDPSVENMRLAKRYAISQGEYIEYIGAGLGFIAFRPGVFDAIFALHSIHHVPGLGGEMRLAREWLREGGGIAVDEHIRHNPVMEALAGRLHEWAQAEVFPKVRTLDIEELHSRLPRAPQSTLEDAGSEEVISSIVDNFVLESVSTRYVSLNSFSFIYYLDRGMDVKSYYVSAGVLDKIYQFFQEAFPDGTEYVAMIGRRDDATLGTPNEVAERALNLMASVEDGYKDAASLSVAIPALQERITRLNADIQARSGYIEELERVFTVKNRHIARLEQIVRGQEEVMKAAPVRAVVGLMGALRGIRRGRRGNKGNRG